MKWPTFPLKQIAPAQASNLRLEPDSWVWHLTLDQIESHTGRIVNKKIGPASDAGTSSYMFDEGNVLYSKLRPYLNKVICPNEPGIATTELVPLRPRPDVLDRRFLTYYLRSQHFLGFANAAVAGVKMPRIIMAKFWQHSIPLPPLSEQRRIVEILDQADALRKKRAEADAKAAHILPALFYKMFGDPISNSMGWPMKPIGDLLSLIRNGTTTEQNTEGRGYPVTRIETISNGIIDASRVRYVELTSRELEKWRMQSGDILFSHINSETHIGKTAIYEGNPEILIHGMNLLLMRPNINIVLPLYLFALLNTQSVRAIYRQRCKRAVNQASLNQKDISSLLVAIPPLELQERFCHIAKNMMLQIGQQKQTAIKLETLFGSLLHRAFTGDLTAKWREAHMKELLAEMEQRAKTLESKSEPKVSMRATTRHAGHDMYNKAALAAFITERCHHPDHPLGRVKLAKIFYLVQKKAELELTESFVKRAAGPLDDDIHKFLNLARKNKWVVLGRAKGDLKPVRPGQNVKEAVEQISKRLGEALPQITEMIEQMKGWGWKALERWATVLHAAEELAAKGTDPTVQSVKDALQAHPVWKDKLNRQEFSDSKLAATLKGLRSFGFIPERT